MYQFPDDLRCAYESSPLSFVYYQNIAGKAIPILVSDGFCRNTGVPREAVLEWLKTGLFERMHPDDVGKVSQVSEEFLHQRGSYDIIFRCRISHLAPKEEAVSEYVIIHGYGQWQTMPDGTMLAVIMYSNLTRTIEMSREKAERYGLFQKDRFYTDPLTELPNINYLHEFGNEKVDMIRADGRTPMIVYSDVESMQSYNNQYGGTEGDRLLCLIADTLKEVFPKALVVRGSDDHFIMLTGVDDHELLTHRMERVNEKIRRNAKGNTSGIRSGVCAVSWEMGVGLVPAIDHAKHALKRMATNLNQCVRFFSQDADDIYWQNRYIIENIDRALENGWIKVYYQALYRVESQKIAAFEALARWEDPVRGKISPAEFIPVLLKYHQLYKLDLYMFEQVCREIPVRDQNHLPMVPVSVNFSRQDFDHVDVLAKMNEIYERTGTRAYVTKNFFIVEITEQDIAEGTDRLKEQLKKIHENGYRLWLDDFGSGYSSLNMFSQFQFDLIKFDMEMIRHLDDNDGANRIILRQLVHLAKELKLHTLIEGVETEEQVEFVKKIGCELIQGYYYYRPQSLKEILLRIKEGGPMLACETREEQERFKKKWLEK